MGEPSSSSAYVPAGMIHVASAVMTMSANRIVYADGSVNRGLCSSMPSSGGLVPTVPSSAVSTSLDMTLTSGCEQRLLRGGLGAADDDRAWRLGRLHVLDAEAGEGVAECDERVEHVEEGVGEVLHRRDAENTRHVGAAAVPGHQRGGHGPRVLHRSRQHPRGQPAASERGPE